MTTTAERKQPPRRSARTTKSPEVAETEEQELSASDASEKRKAAQSQSEGRPKRKTRVAAEAPPPKKRKAPTENYRLLKKRNLPLVRKGFTLRDQVKEEFALLLKCDESLTPSKELGVNAQRATMNRAWEERYLDFLVFSKEYDHKHVPKMYTENPALGRWVVKMRSWKKNKDKNLTPSRLQRLEAAGFIWDPKSDPDFYKIQGDNEKALDLWEENFNELLEFKEEHGDCMVPKSFPPNERLARWVSRQRRHYKAKQNNEYHTLTDDKEKRLLDVGFVFITRTTELLRQSALKQSEDKWESYCKKLAAFKEEYGHCAVPRRWKRDTQLASWVMRQRIQWKNKQQGQHSYLTDERIEQLKEIGFVFGAIDRKTYPVDGLTRGTPKASTLWTKKSDSADEEESDDDEESDEVAETVEAPPAKRAKTDANKKPAAKKTSRTAKTSVSAEETSDDNKPDKAVMEPSSKRSSRKSTDAAKMKIARTRTTKASVSAEEASVAERPDDTETEASEGEKEASAPANSGSPKTNTADAVLKRTTRRTRTSASAEGAADAKEPVESEVLLGEEELQQTIAAALGKRVSPSPKTTANDAEKQVATRSPKTNANEAGKPKTTRGTKTSVPAEEASNKEEPDESGVSQGDESTEKTVMAPPGSLGIIISNLSKSKGTMISDVRPTSVLIDKVSPGDRIIAIDGEDVSLLTASELSKIMASKKESEKKLTIVTASDDEHVSLIKDKKKRKKKREMDEDATKGKEEAQESTGREKGTQQAAAAVIATNAKEPTKKIKWVIYPGKSKVKS